MTSQKMKQVEELVSTLTKEERIWLNGYLTGLNAANGSTVGTVSTGGTRDKHSGMDADNCCRIYVGDANKVKRYKSSLACTFWFSTMSA